jgi:hypothetical protein
LAMPPDAAAFAIGVTSQTRSLRAHAYAVAIPS